MLCPHQRTRRHPLQRIASSFRRHRPRRRRSLGARATPSRWEPSGSVSRPRRFGPDAPPPATMPSSPISTPRRRRAFACESARTRAGTKRDARPNVSPPPSASPPMSPSDKSEARLGRVLITEAELDARIHVLGQAIAHDYAKEGETERPILVGVLQGAFLFMADLIRRIPMDVSTDFISLAATAPAPAPPASS